jgi:hypothetical protein
MRHINIACILCLFCAALVAAQDCSQFNVSPQGVPYGNNDGTQHLTGVHGSAFLGEGTCKYTGTSGNCSVTCGASMDVGGSENGTLDNPILVHLVVKDQKGGSATSNGGSAMCGSAAGVAIYSCVRGSPCPGGVTFTGGGPNGIGISVSFTGAPVWKDSDTYTNTCQSKTLPTGPSNPTPPPPPACTAPPGPPPYNPPCGDYWDSTFCLWMPIGSCTPIVLDTTGGGFALTSASNGVAFDIAANGHPVQVAWTTPGHGNAFLVLDRNNNGEIDDGSELFGSSSPQPASADPNGFAALAVYDTPAQGGDGDGVIDSRDAVFSRLRLWIDDNHDGVSQPSELHTLPSLGVYSLGLRYHATPKTDQYGNKYRYVSLVNPTGKKDNVDRRDYDVFLTTAPIVPSPPATSTVLLPDRLQ